MKVACIKWGLKYGPEYVVRLRNGVKRFLPIPHEFICFTENPVDGIECRPLPTDLPSWWSKVGLFKPGVLEGDILYLDLDVVITDYLLSIVALLYSSPGLWARDDFSYSMKKPKKLDGPMRQLLGGDGCINSSVMLWKNDAARMVWDKFTPEVMNVMHGDQNWISHVLGKERLHFIPEHFVGSYKYGKLNQEAYRPVMCFHGDPKPHALPEHHPLRLMWQQ